MIAKDLLEYPTNDFFWVDDTSLTFTNWENTKPQPDPSMRYCGAICNYFKLQYRKNSL